MLLREQKLAMQIKRRKPHQKMVEQANRDDAGLGSRFTLSTKTWGVRSNKYWLLILLERLPTPDHEEIVL